MLPASPIVAKQTVGVGHEAAEAAPGRDVVLSDVSQGAADEAVLTQQTDQRTAVVAGPHEQGEQHAT